MILSDTVFHEMIGAITRRHVVNAISASIILVAGIFISRRMSHALSRLPNLDSEQSIALRKISYYLFVAFVIAATLSQLGFDLRVLLGAAGVMTVAIGFAAQTSASNLISGLFLMIDRPFRIGDIVRIGETTGEVMAIDMLSSKIRTFDNIMVRIPNETMVKSNISNLSRFPIRRIDLKFGVGYSSDMREVEAVLMDVAFNNPLCLAEPSPMFLFTGFGASSQDLQFSVWVVRTNMALAQNQLLAQIKERFDSEGIEIPYPYQVQTTPPEPRERPRGASGSVSISQG